MTMRWSVWDLHFLTSKEMSKRLEKRAMAEKVLTPPLEPRPDVVVMDLVPELDGVQATLELLSQRMARSQDFGFD